jgi:hypothetical protein
VITLIEVLVIVAVLALIVRALARWSRTKRMSSQRWEPRIRSIGVGTVVELVREGQPTMRIATLDPGAEDFTMQLEEARAAAMERAMALNSAGQGLSTRN